MPDDQYGESINLNIENGRIGNYEQDVDVEDNSMMDV